MTFEPVYTMTDWYDGPRRGVASFNGRPYLYESCWSNIESDEDDMFLLSPISDRLFAAVIEDWEIWRRWEVAYKSGSTTIETHPALPNDRERHVELATILKAQLGLDEHDRVAAKAIFRYNSDKEPSVEAEWTIVDYVQSKDRRDKYRWTGADGDEHKPLHPSS